MFFDPIYLFSPMPALMLAAWAIGRMRSARNEAKGKMVGFTGAESASRVLSAAGLATVKIQKVEGSLSDHFDPVHQVIRLSNRVHEGRSLDVIAIAIREAGQAVDQPSHRISAFLRPNLLPLALLGSSLFWLLLLSSVVLSNVPFFLAAVGVLSLNVAVQVAGLPLEHRANRAISKSIDECLNLEASERPILQRSLDAEALRTLGLTLTGAFQEARLAASQRVLR